MAGHNTDVVDAAGAEMDEAWVLRCDKMCNPWSFPDLGLASLTGPELVRRAHRPRSMGRRRLAWFMCLTQPPQAALRLMGRESIHKIAALQNLDTARTAIISALLHAPSLVPHVLYLLPGGIPFREDNFTRWLCTMNVPMIVHRLSFEADLYRSFGRGRQTRFERGTLRYGPAHINIGTYGRMDLPFIVANHTTRWAREGIDVERVLYTDTDVIFAGDFDLRQLRYTTLPSQPAAGDAKVHTFVAGTEVFNPSLNAGVMLLNVSAMRAEWRAMLQFAQKERFKFRLNDQEWLVRWFAQNASPTHRHGWHTFDDAMWNARAYEHTLWNRTAAVVPPRLWHWHGPKPHHVACWLRQLRHKRFSCNRSMRIRYMWKPPLTNCKSDSIRSNYPLRNCALRTYAWLQAQHRRMNSLAADVEVLAGSGCGPPQDGPADVGGRRPQNS